MVSHASDVKKELISLPVHPEHAKTELAALLQTSGVLGLHDHQFSPGVTTENPAITRRIFPLIKTAYGIEPLLTVPKKMKLEKNYQYLVRFQKRVRETLSDLEIFDSDSGLITEIPEKIMALEQRAVSHLRGASLAAGSVSNPKASRYHLEIHSLYENHNSDLLKSMDSFFYLDIKAIERRNGYVVYLKETEKIGDLLRIVGTVSAMLAFEDLRVMRDMRNSVSRLVDRGTVNLKEAANAAAKRVGGIQLIEKKVGLEDLPEELVILTHFRLMHPELSLKEVAAQVPDGLTSRSGINYRFQKIRETVQQLKEED